MGEPVFWGRFVLAVLATWRVAHLLTGEDGPGGVIAWVQARLGRSILGQMMDCFGCAGLWVAAPFAVFVPERVADGRVADMVVIWLAVAGGAYLIELWRPASVMIEPGDDTEPRETTDGML